MRYVHTDGVYYLDEAAVDGIAVYIEVGEVVEVRDRVPDNAEALY